MAVALIRSRDVEDRFIPLSGLLAAFVFAAQTLQFPVPGGTSGHLVGAALVTILLGPAMGMVVICSVLFLEALVFGTGGLLALGWNSVNMALVMGLLGSTVYHGLHRRGASLTLAAFSAGWLGTAFGSLVTCLELAVAGTSPLLFSLPAMMTTQSLVGVGEGLVTAGAVSYLARTRPDLIPKESSRATAAGYFVALLILLGALLPPEVYGLSAEQTLVRRYPGLVVAGGLGLVWVGLGLALKLFSRPEVKP